MNDITKKIFRVVLIFSAAQAALLAIPLLAQTTIPITPQQIDELSTKSDRWLFLAALVLLLGFGAMVIKWLLSQLDRQREANAKAHQEQLEYLKSNGIDVVTALKSNTNALQECDKSNKEIVRLLNDDHRVLALLNASEQAGR